MLYVVPALIVLACLFYEQTYLDKWMTTWHYEICKDKQFSIPCPLGKHVPKDQRPEFAVFMIKYLMCMIVGITSSFWIWSNKTLHSWQVFCNTIRGRKQEAYV